MKTTKEAIAAIDAYLLVNLELPALVGEDVTFTTWRSNHGVTVTHNGNVYAHTTDDLFVGLVDARNFLVYGKAWKQ